MSDTAIRFAPTAEPRITGADASKFQLFETREEAMEELAEWDALDGQAAYEHPFRAPAVRVENGKLVEID